MPEGCQRSKRSLNWPPIVLYNYLVQLVQTTKEGGKKGENKTKNTKYKGVTCTAKQTSLSIITILNSSAIYSYNVNI